MKISKVIPLYLIIFLSYGCVQEKQSLVKSGSNSAVATVITTTNINEPVIVATINALNETELDINTLMYEVPAGVHDMEVIVAFSSGSDFSAFLNVMGFSGAGGFKVSKALYKFSSFEFDRDRTYRLKIPRKIASPFEVCFESKPGALDVAPRIGSEISWPAARVESCGEFIRAIE